MHKSILISLISIFLYSCQIELENKKEKSPNQYLNKQDTIERNSKIEDDTINLNLTDRIIDTANFAINLIPKGNYNKLKAQIKSEKQRLNKIYLSKKDSISKNQILNTARNFITNTLLNKIFPHWYGMIWDFSGYSAIPQKGEVGCSYFVSNTLLHMGFNVNRYKLAQQGPLNETKSLDKLFKTYLAKESLSGKITRKHTINEIIKQNKSGLYFVGLRNHVGYLLIHKNDLFFIHSNYGELKVMLEYAETSQEFVDSQYYIANITFNDELIKKWLLNEKITIILD